MSTTPSASLATVMRIGYGARGVIYALLGGLTLAAALTASRAEGTQDALRTLRAQPFGQAILWIIALGLVCYMVWRLFDALLDLECQGTDAKGIAARIGQAGTGLLHGALGLSTAALALGRGAGGGAGGGAGDWTARLMSMPFGRWLVGAVALIVVGAGIYYAAKGLRGSYKAHLRRTRLTERIDTALKWGLVAHGVVVGIIGVSLGYAALTTDPQQAGGLGQALATIRGAAFGRILLGLTGLGLLGFAAYNFVEAAYRIVPRIAERDVRSLAREAAS